MARPPLPTVEVLRQLLRFDPESGKLFWLHRPASLFVEGLRSAEHSAKVWNAAWAGKEAFTVTDQSGYKVGTIFLRRGIQAHRVAWALMMGEWPLDEIDHINGDSADNRWANLRLVSHHENGRNQALSRLNTSGNAGVRQANDTGHWVAYIYVEKKRVALGSYLTREEAIAARYGAERALGFHENHGKRPRLTLKRRYRSMPEGAAAEAR